MEGAKGQKKEGTGTDKKQVEFPQSALLHTPSSQGHN